MKVNTRETLASFGYEVLEKEERIVIRHKKREVENHLLKRFLDEGINAEYSREGIIIEGDNVYKFQAIEEELIFAMQKIVEKAKKEKIAEKINEGLGILNIRENVELMYKVQPFFYDSNKFFFMWNLEDKSWVEIDEIDIMNVLDLKLKLTGQTHQTQIKTQYMEAIKRFGRIKKPKPVSKHWVQFQDCVFDIKTKKCFQATPEFFYRNPIPHNLGKSEETPVIDKLINEWVGQSHFKTVKEILAYSTINDYPIHTIFAFTGNGRNGKSTLLNLIKRFLGISNICSTSLDSLVKNRFEAFNLWGKRVALMGETNFGMLDNTDMIKRLSGGDTINFEAKNKNAFFDVNFAKLIIATNGLPTSDDVSDGFYRRWCIIHFPNEFEKAKDVLSEIPEEEYENLCFQAIKILPDLLKRGEFSGQGDIIERKRQYIMASNPLELFIEKFCEIGEDDQEFYTTASKVYTFYCEVLRHNKMRVIKKKELHQAMTDLGYEYSKVRRENETGWMYLGVKLKNDYRLCDKNLRPFINSVTKRGVCDKNPLNLTQNPYRESNSEPCHNCHNCHKPENASETLEKLRVFIKKNPDENKAKVLGSFDPFFVMDVLDKGYIFEAKKGCFMVNEK